MFFKIEKEMFDANPNIYTGVVVAKGLNNSGVNKEIAELLEGEIAKINTCVSSGAEISGTENIAAYNNAMKKMGVNADKYPCSIDAIVARIKKQGAFPSISPVVDLGNYISVKYRVPVGVHDADSLDNDLCVRCATEEDCAIEENSIKNDALTVGEPVYACGDSVRTRRWLWRQMPAGKTTEESNSFIFPIDGFVENKEIVDAAVEELTMLIKKFFNVDAENGVIKANDPEFRFGVLTPEEEDIENQIAIMLKGAAQHTDVSDVRKKIAQAKKENRPLRVKLGLDPSAPDIHVGHSVVLRKIRQLQDLGHKAVIIIGDYTGMIGDPTGKSKTRKQLTREEVEANANTYMEQIFKVIDKDKTEVHYNSTWLSKMSFGDVIELAAKCTVARMLERDDFNNRYVNHLPLSVHEFFYPLMQAYDSVAIQADVELGGTDQTFNILMGRNIQRDYGLEPQIALFMPLLEGIDGNEKMSKSLGNYIGISEEPGIIYEKVMKIPDALIIKYYNLCTDIHPSEIAAIEASLENGKNPRDVKMQLAFEITKLYHGEAAAQEAEVRFKNIFQKNELPADAAVIEVDASAELPQCNQIIDYLVANKVFSSKGEVRRLFNQGAVQVDGVKQTDTQQFNVEVGDHVLKIGKNKMFKLLVK